MTRYKDERDARAAGLKPGATYQTIEGYQAYIPWRKEDLDPNDTVTFVAQENPSMRYGLDTNGKRYVIMDVNGLKCTIWLSELQTINRVFYQAYQDSLNIALDNERFKRTGPKPAMWDEALKDEDGNWISGWYYNPEAVTAWMDQDGKYIRPDEYYQVATSGPLEGMPISLGKHKDLIEAGTHPDYRRPPQLISYRIAISVLWQAIQQSVRLTWQKFQQLSRK